MKIYCSRFPMQSWCRAAEQKSFELPAVYMLDTLVSADYNDTLELVDDKSFQCEVAQLAEVFDHLITLPTYHNVTTIKKESMFITREFITSV